MCIAVRTLNAVVYTQKHIICHWKHVNGEQYLFKRRREKLFFNHFSFNSIF